MYHTINANITNDTAQSNPFITHRFTSNSSKKEIDGLGYAGSTKKRNNKTGVTVHNNKASKGVIFYTSGHKPSAFLIEKNGNLLHKWSMPENNIFPNTGDYAATKRSRHWRRAFLSKNGSVIAIYDHNGILALDKQSNKKWSRGIRAHHDAVLTRNRIYTLVSKEKKSQLMDYIYVLDKDTGKTIKKYNIKEAIRNSSYSGLYEVLIDSNKYDIMHTNTIEVLGEEEADYFSHPAFQKGRILLSIRASNSIVLFDPEQKAIVWAKTGLTKAQHENTMTPNGNLLVFDNKWQNKKSRVIKYNPGKDNISWIYKGNGVEQFYSSCCGSIERLNNGNLLIAETGAARLLEVTPDKEVVWSYVNPHKDKDKDKYGVIFSAKQFKKSELTFIEQD